MSKRAWVLFFCLTSVLAGAAWTAPFGGDLRVAHARVTVDLETGSCRVLSVDHQ